MNNTVKTVAGIIALAAVGMAFAAGWNKYQDYRQKELAEALTVKDREFAFEQLSEMARKLAEKPYVAPADNLPDELKKLNYDQYRDIRFSRENGPWYGKKLPFEIQFFHPGALFLTPVAVNEIVNGKIHPLKYSTAYFDYGKNSLDTNKLTDIGYAGFRLHSPLNTRRYYDELISFLGASYFRALGRHLKYGLSARGLAIDTAVETGEEFPIFREFWIVRPKRKDKTVTVYALLDSPSAAGIYTFVITPGESTVMDVDARIFPRKEINKLGIAPLTSMYLFGENTKNKFDDHRPEVHDSDGLLVLNGNSEWLWRPLDNSEYLRISAFVDENPKGFGLLQRDRNAAHFASDNAALNAVWELCRYSIEATSAFGIYIDGDRERIPYEADAIINQLGHYAVDREYAMARRSSEYLLQHPTWPTEWIMQALIIAWNDYLYTGDLRSIEANYETLAARTLRSLRRNNGLISTRAGDEIKTDTFRRSIRFNGDISDIVDWPRGSEDDNYAFTDYNTVVNAFHYRAMQLLGRMAETLGRHDEAHVIADYCSSFRDTFNAALFDTATGTYRDGIGTDHRSLHANIFPLAFGLVPEKCRQGVVDYIRSRGMACSVYAAQFLMDGLYDAAEADYALHLLTKDDLRSWRNMLRAGATITFEAWDNSFKPNQDWNHAWGAAPADIIPMRLVGVRPTTPAAATIEVRPQTASLRHVTADVPTIRGTVEVDIDNTSDTYRLRVRIPANTDARILLPAPDYKYTLRRDGRRIRPRKSGDTAFIYAGTVPSGEYVFTVKRAE